MQNHLRPPEKDYTAAIEVARQADIAFTKAHGCGGNIEAWDAALEDAVEAYNTANLTNFDPIEARLQYIDQQELLAYGWYVGTAKIKQALIRAFFNTAIHRH